MEEIKKRILIDKLLKLGLVKKDDEIHESTFLEFEKATQGIEISTQTADQMGKYLFGIHQKDRYETVTYYRFLIAENFSRLIADIDKHVLYNLPKHYIHTSLAFDAFYRIELTANFINFVESICAVYTVSQEWKKSFSDKEFEKSLKDLVEKLTLNFSILKKIRNKLHHACYVRIIQANIINSSSNINLIALEKSELLRKVDDLTQKEILLLDKYSVGQNVDLKPLVVDTFQEYSDFLQKYHELVRKLLQRLTGTEFQLTL